MNNLNKDLPPSQALLLDGVHRHRASCHGPVGELQCGLPEDLEWEVGQVKSPLSMFERVSLMVACYVVIFAGVMLIFGIIDLYMFLDRVGQALESWGNQLDVS